MSIRSKAIALLLLLGGAVLTGLWSAGFFSPPKVPAGITLEEVREVQRAYRQLHGKGPDQDHLLLVLGERSAATERWDAAIECLGQVSGAETDLRASALFQLGQIEIDLNNSVAAEQSFTEFLSIAASLSDVDPQEINTARHWLSFLYSAQLRYEERQGVLTSMLHDGQANIYDIKQRFFPNLLIWNSSLGRERNREFLAKVPGDSWANLAEVRYRMGEGRLLEAEELLSELQAKGMAGKHWLAVRLELDYEQDDWAVMEQHLREFDQPAESDPWMLIQMRGEAALHAEDWPKAIKLFEALIAVEPAHLAAHMGLARALRESGDVARSETVAAQARWLARIRPELSSLTESNLQEALTFADECDLHGMTAAATALREYAARQNPQASVEGDVP